MNADELKAAIGRFVDEKADEIERLSLAIHEAAELGLEEHRSCDMLTKFLSKHGMQTECGTGGLPTAFKATFYGNSNKPVVAFLAEYDALPVVGHACGHNIIGASAAASGAALASLGSSLPGCALVFGTPAEENAGGKVVMTRAGVFEGVDAVFMNHPGSGESKMGGSSLAIHSFAIRYKGKPAHAAGSPHEGVNALDAACIFLHAVGLLRQHVSSDVRLHGIITKGGDATNIIPEFTEVRYLARAPRRSDLDRVAEKVRGCIRAGCEATGCTVEITETKNYEPVKPNKVLAEVLCSNYIRAGFPMSTEMSHAKGSTDLGEVSQVVPQANSKVRIAPESVVGHSHEFALASASPEGRAALLASAKAMAWSAIDVMTDPGLLKAAWEEFNSTE